MPDSDLERDCLFQLNVLVWASLPQPSNAPVTPVLRNVGYTLWSVEQPLRAGTLELARLVRGPVEISPNPVADAVFHHIDADLYVLAECKPESFGVDSMLARQARGLIAAAETIASRLGLAGDPSAEVCYVVPGGQTQIMEKTLVALTQQIADIVSGECPTGAICISVRANGVYLGPIQVSGGAARLPRDLLPEQQVLVRREGQDPRPLYFIPWVPDAPDETDLRAFREKMRAHLLAWLGRIPTGEATLEFDVLLDEVSRGVFGLWRSQGSLKGRIFPTAASLVGSLFGSDHRVTVRRRSVRVTLYSNADRDELMERVRIAKLPSKLPDGVQLPLEEAELQSQYES